MAEPILEFDQVSVTFRGSRRHVTHALNSVSFRLDGAEIVGLAGESGSGKSTIARVAIGLQPHAAGRVLFGGVPLAVKRDARQRRLIQMVFQDPAASLDPRMTVEQSLTELIRFHGIARGAEATRHAEAMVERVKLPRAILSRRPHQMSGGQRQRVAIARALVLEPQVLIADEAVSALDVSVQAGIVRLFAELRVELGLSILFISHDLGVIRSLCDRVIVLQNGSIVEDADVDALFDAPQHPYTRNLLNAVPRFDRHLTDSSRKGTS